MNDTNIDKKVRQFRDQVEFEDERRRVMTRFGYRFTNNWFTTFCMATLVILLVQVLVVFGVVFTGGLPRGAASDPRSLLIFTPMAVLPPLLLIYKWRYARWGLVFLAALGGLAWLGVELLYWIVD